MPEIEEKKVGFLDEDVNTKSSMRLMCFLSLLSAIAFGAITLLHTDTEGSTGLFITMAFLLGAFAPKALQKMLEEKLPTK